MKSFEDTPTPEPVARLFIALWPPPDLAAAFCARCASGSAGTRAETPQRVHLTLHFLGYVARSRLPGLRAALCVPFGPFELRLNHCTRWPQGVVVLEPDTVPPALALLHAELARVIGALGLRAEERTFRPHVTLLRRHPGPWSASADAAVPLRWPVRDYVLVESVPGQPDGYRVLQTCHSRTAAPPAGPASGRRG